MAAAGLGVDAVVADPTVRVRESAVSRNVGRVAGGTRGSGTELGRATRLAKPRGLGKVNSSRRCWFALEPGFRCTFNPAGFQLTLRMNTLFYAVCLVGGLLFTVISALAGHLFHGGDHGGDVGTGGHAESGFDNSGIPGISFFSPLVLSCFITAFGGIGIVFSGIEATSSVWLSAPLSAAGAFCIALLVLWLFNTVFSKSQGSSEGHVASLVGQTATLLSPIPENGVGEIAYVQASTRYTAPARSEKGNAIPGGATVQITRVVGTQFFVDRIV